MHIPDTLAGRPVTRIGIEAFRSCSSLTGITIPDSVISIGYSAFYGCHSLTSVTLGNQVTELEPFVFAYCHSLAKIVIPGSITSISIHAFDSCSNLSALTLGTGLTSIGSYAFSKCTSLTSIVIPNQVKSIGTSAFGFCTSLTAVIFSNSSTSIGDSAFHTCSSLTILTLGNSLTSIGTGAFSWCVNLPAITIPASVASIGAHAFSNCESLTDITVESGNPFYHSVNGVLFDVSMTTIIKCPEAKQGTYTIPESVTIIGDYAFSGCSKLTVIVIPTGVTIIADGTFMSCRSLTAVTIPDNVHSIGDRAFNGCSSLEDIIIPPSVSSIGDWAFYDCSSLTGINISQTVTRIGKYAFGNCGSLMGITVAAANPVYRSEEGVLFDKTKTTLLQYPGGSPGPYSIPEGVTAIAPSAFAFCLGLTGVTLPESIAGIGSNAFASCSSLTDIMVHPANPAYSSAGGVLFHEYEGSAELLCFPGGKAGHYRIPDGVTTIWPHAFLDCPHLTGLTIPASLGLIRDDAFGVCGKLMGIYFEGDAPELGESSEFSNIPANIYFMPGAADWEAIYGWRPAVKWDPQIQTGDPSFGMKTDGAGGRFFAFTITGPPGSIVVVKASSGMATGTWMESSTVTLADPDLDGIGSASFRDPEAGQNAARFYRLSMP